MDFEKAKKDGVDFLVATGIGTTATVVGLHAARKIPQYAGWVLLGAGALGYMFGGKVFKAPAIIAASLGGVALLNKLGNSGGVPAITGWKGMVNKVVPQLNGVDGFAGFGNVEMMNEQLLGMGNLDQEQIATDLDSLTGLGNLDKELLGNLM